MTLKLCGDTPKGYPNCGVVALSVATQTPYREVEKWWKVRRRGNWRGRTHVGELLKWLTEHGYSYKEFLITGRNEGNLRNHHLKGTFERGKTYLILTTGHFQVYRDGYVADQSCDEGVPVSEFWGKGKQVKMFFEIGVYE